MINIKQEFSGEDTGTINKLEQAYRIALNDLNGLDVIADQDFLGFKFKPTDSDYTAFCLYYLQSTDDWHATEAIADVYQGIDIEDERTLVKNVTMTRAMAAIKEHDKKCRPTLYPTFIETSEGFARQCARPTENLDSIF